MNDQFKILLIEDSPNDEKLVNHTLRNANLHFVMKRIETEEEIRNEIPSFQPDLILTDYSLSNFDALRVFEIVKEVNSKVPIIIVTGSQTEEVVVQCMKRGADDYILKNNLLRLPSAVQNIIEKIQIEKDKNSVQKALRTSEELYKLITENTQDLICVLDKEGYLLYVNSSFKKVLNYNIKNLIGTNYFLLIHPNDRDFMIKLFEESFVSRSTQTTELRYKDVKGGWHIFESVGNWIIDDKDTPSKIVVISRDLTERQKWEDDIVKAKERAEEAAEFKSWFVSAISHEIRTPLNVILGYTNIIKETIVSYNPDLVNVQFFRNIEKAGRRLLNTITQILDISKIDAGQFPIEIEPVSLNYCIKTTFELIKVMAEEKKLHLSYDLPNEEVFVIADEYCVNGLLTNLLSNAIKYSDAGEIKVSAKKQKKNGLITVEDQGVGMSDEYLTHLYETFRQEESIKRRYEGAGLGLALTKKYVELMHGKIDVESVKNVGTKITVRLPLEKVKEKIKS